MVHVSLSKSAHLSERISPGRIPVQ